MLEILKSIGLIIYFICGWKLCSDILAKMGIITVHASLSDWFIGRFMGALFLGSIGVVYYGFKIIYGLFSRGSKTED